MKPAFRGAFLLTSLLIFSFQIGRADASITINIQPTNQTVSVGETAVFGAVVVTTAGEAITDYQWFMSTNSGGPFTVVGNAGALVLTNVQVANAGYYYAEVTFQFNGGKQTLDSAVASLAVIPQPRILTQPVSATIPPGSNATISVTAAGAPPLTFQWRHGGTNLSDNLRLTGTDEETLQIQNLLLSDSGGYDIVVANSYGSVTSQVATLNVSYIPSVFISATNAIGKQGYAFNYSMIATGSPPITFGADGLPNGLSVNSTNGAIFGIPSVYGLFNVTLYATNLASTSITNLTITLADDIPVIVSVTNASGKQGFFFSYTIAATNDPSGYSAESLPLGLTVNKATGVISGIPLVNGAFSITIDATNIYGSTSKTLTLSLAPGAPVITSSLTKNGKQGQPLSYTIKATNNPALYSAGPLPSGIVVDPNSGLISGVPLVSGTFSITIGSVNAFGSDSQTLTLNLASSVPVITSSLTAAGDEEGNFSYTIKANNSPNSFWATGLPTGLTVNTNTGAITGIPLYAGSYSVELFAANAWGVGTNTLQLTVNNLTIGGLAITDLSTNYYAPYLLEFRFALRDSDDPLASHAVVASPGLMSVTAFEDNNTVSPTETGVILQPVGRDGAKVLKGYLVLDFTESMSSLDNGDLNQNGISDAVDAETASAQAFVDQQPPDSQLGVFEFHRDDEAPQQVISLTNNKALVDNAIAGIWTNYVQGFPAGSRAWDAVSAAITALGPTNANERHYIVLMSDGQDDSSTKTVDNVISAATAAGIQVYCVGFGSEVDSVTLQNLADSTLGRYYEATNLAALPLSFAKIGKDLSSQYILRWATLKRSANTFMPSFQITYQGFTALSPSNPPPFVSGTNFVVVTNNGVVDTNAVLLYTTNYVIPPYKPTAYAGNVLGGFLRLATDPDVQPSGITLRAVYTPRYIQQMRLHFHANWPVSLQVDATNSGGFLDGWSVTRTNDGTGGEWAILNSPNPSNLAASMPFAEFGKMLTFSFKDPIGASNAFSLFTVDNTIYTNPPTPSFYGFNLTNSANFVTSLVQPPPHGTPIPWLLSHGFTSSFDTAELSSPNGNGLTVWQDYIAGLNPSDPNSTFGVGVTPAQYPPQIVFQTVVGRNYRIEWSTGLNGPWSVLRDGITGTGGNVTFTDLRDMSFVTSMYYRVAAEIP